MPLELILAPAAGGKTQYLIHEIRRALQKRPLAPIWVLAPDRLHARAFVRRLGRAGGVLGVTAATFDDLYLEILERAGAPRPQAGDAALHLLLQSLVDDLHQQGELTHYAGIRRKPGFLRVLRERFGELQRAGVSLQTFLDTAMQAGDSPGLVELAQLYRAYLRRLDDLGWGDPDGLGRLALEALETDPGLLADCQLLAVDSFTTFTPLQRRLFSALAGRTPRLLLTLPYGAESGASTRPAFARSQGAIEELVRELDPQITRLPGKTSLPAPLASLERQLFAAEIQPAPDLTTGQHLHLLEVRSPAEEAREALRWIKATHLRRGVPLERCAVFAQDPDRYETHLRRAAREFGLRLRFIWGQTLIETPAASALLNLFGLPSEDYPRRRLLDALRSPFFSLEPFGFLPGDAGLMELVSQQGQVSGGLDQWRQALEMAATAAESQSVPETLIGEEEYAPPRLPNAQETRRLGNAVDRFHAAMAEASARSMAEWIAWLEDGLERLDFPTRCEADVLLALRNTLRGLLLGGAVLESTERPRIDRQRFIEILYGAIEASIYRPPVLEKDAVLVGRLVEAHGLRFEAAAVLGLSEGVFPVVERADPFIDEAVRAQLGLQPYTGRGQTSDFYQSVTRADRHLLLTRPYLAEGGEAWEPSPYWESVKDLFPEAVSRLHSDAPRRLPEAASHEELLFWSARQGVSPPPGAQLAARQSLIAHARDVLQARLNSSARSPYEGFPAALSQTLTGYYNQDFVWSASRLESYGSCPHQFYVSNALGLEAKEPPEPGFDGRQLGSMLHSILEHAYRQAADPADPQSVLAELETVAVHEFEQAPRRYGFRPSPLWESEQRDMIENLRKTVIQLAEDGPEWRPYQFEARFGLSGYPPLELETKDAGRIRMRGFIDRLDRDDSGRLRVLDYKTGASHLDKKDLIAGRRLQLPLYALAARQALRLGQVIDGLYWSILSPGAHLRLERFEHEDYQGFSGAVDMAIEHVERIVQGIRLAEYPPVPPDGGCPSYCPAAAWCWQYKPGF